MSPEQCRSAANIDHRSDIYTLGCILFELVTGEPPFDGEVGELIAKHQMVAAPTARSKNPDVPAALDTLITQTLAKQPGERPQTMAGLARSLEGGGSSNALSAGTAPTLLPDAAESLQRFTPPPGSLPALDSEGSISSPAAHAKARGAAATTLGAANVSRAVGPTSAVSSKRTLAIVAVAGLALAGGGIFLATRNSKTDEAPRPPVAASGSAPASEGSSASSGASLSTSTSSLSSPPSSTISVQARANTEHASANRCILMRKP
jgi:serine/threonine-protein kinase